MKKPHKHAELIKAWADGAEIQFRYNANIPWSNVIGVCGWDKDCEFRIKPEPKPDVVEHMSIYRNLNRRYETERPIGEPKDCAYVGNVQLTWDGTTGKLKSAEVI